MAISLLLIPHVQLFSLMTIYPRFEIHIMDTADFKYSALNKNNQGVQQGCQ